MQGVLPSIDDFGVQRPDTGFFTRPLSDRELRLEVLVELLRLNFEPVRADHQVLQAQVDAQRLAGQRFERASDLLHLDRDVQIPATSSVFAEVAGAEAVAVPERQCSTAEPDFILVKLEVNFRFVSFLVRLILSQALSALSLYAPFL